MTGIVNQSGVGVFVDNRDTIILTGTVNQIVLAHVCQNGVALARVGDQMVDVYRFLFFFPTVVGVSVFLAKNSIRSKIGVLSPFKIYLVSVGIEASNIRLANIYFFVTTLLALPFLQSKKRCY